MTALRRVFPAPFLSAGLFLMWMAIADAPTKWQLLLAVLLAVTIPLITGSVRAAPARVRHPAVVVSYIARVMFDVVHFNIIVARDVLALRRRQPQSAFVVIPLELRDPVGLAILSMVTTVVPGTIWSELALDRTALMLHVWHVTDEAEFIERYKARYEQPLREIFQ